MRLSVGELAGGLSTFLGGTYDAKANAVYNVVDPYRRDSVSKSVLQEFLKPYVWCMVPDSAAVLRPILLPHVTDQIANEMSLSPNSYITRQEFLHWLQRGQPGAVYMQNFETVIVANAIVERAAYYVDGAMSVAWMEYQQKYSLREYGQQTWAQRTGGEAQQLRDVGVYRYAQNAVGAAPLMGPMGQTPNQPTLWQNLTNSVAEQTSSAYNSIGNIFTAQPRTSRTRSESIVSVGTLGTQRRMSGSIVLAPTQELPPPPPPMPQSPPAVRRMSVTIPQATAVAPQPQPQPVVPLQSLPPTAAGLTRPAGLMIPQTYGAAPAAGMPMPAPQYGAPQGGAAYPRTQSMATQQFPYQTAAPMPMYQRR